MNKKAKNKAIKNLKECFKDLAEIEITLEEQEELKQYGITDKNYNMLIAFRTLQRALNGDNKALKIYLELTEQDKETELKEKELDFKKNILAIKLGEYKKHQYETPIEELIRELDTKTIEERKKVAKENKDKYVWDPFE